MPKTKLVLSTDEYLEQFREPGSKVVPYYLLPLHPPVPDRRYPVFMEFWKSGNRFSQLAIWWCPPGDDTMSEIVLKTHTDKVLTFGHVMESTQMIKPLRMQPYEASGTIPARPAYDVWPVWPYVLDFTVCRVHGGVSFRLQPPRMATHFSVSASLSTCMNLGFTNKQV